MMFWWAISAWLIVQKCQASESVFSVNDDLFAFPQYEVVFSESYIAIDDVAAKIQQQSERKVKQVEDKGASSDVSFHHNGYASTDGGAARLEEYEIMKMHGRPYFCTLPIVEPSAKNQTEEKPSKEEIQKELARATDKGRELLQGMEGNQCLFYSTGWWTYSFCYNSQVRQFHALPPGSNGGRVWPPQEDPATPSYVLGKINQKPSKESTNDGPLPRTDLAELQTQAETSYLVQKLEGGTPCDLTGENRKVEIQYHCNPQLTDRIAWIKETATCSYLMEIHTPRLCNDVAFQPPKETRAHPITCQEILSPSEVSAWKAKKAEEGDRKMIGQGGDQPLVVGDIEIGAKTFLGKDAKTIERGRIVLTSEEKAETIAMQKDGQVSSMSKSDLKKLDIDPEDIEMFRKELQKLAGNKDWKIERLDDVNGQVQLRGVVSADDEPKKKQEDEKLEQDEEGGSEETYKEEL